MGNSRFRLDGRVCIVTGGAGILGEPMCRALLQQGASVAIVDREIAALDAVAARLQDGAGGRLLTVRADITDRDELVRAQAEIRAALGDADVLVNNAAAKSPNFFEPFETFPLSDWNQVLGVNLTGSMLCCQVFGAPMAERRRGSIVNTLSIYGIVAPDQRIYEGAYYDGRAINTPAVYSASKAGLWGLTKYLATYWGAAGVRVNAITPGGVFSGQNDKFVQRYSSRVPLGRMAERDEMASAVVYLASDASSYVTGHNLVVDGGLTAW